MTRKKRKTAELKAKTQRSARGAANIHQHEHEARVRDWWLKQAERAPEPTYILRHLYEAARRLFERRPETRSFTTDVFSYESVDARVGPDGGVAMVPKIDVTFTEDTPAHWWFDGHLAFITGELYDGNNAATVELLATAEGRELFAALVVEAIKEEKPWFAEKLVHFRVKDGHARGDNIIVQVSLALLDAQEQAFADLVVALQKADGLASVEMSKGALGMDRDTASKRAAFAAAREALARMQEAAETPRQKKLAERALRYEGQWRRQEETLDRIDAMGAGNDLTSGSRYHLNITGVDAVTSGARAIGNVNKVAEVMATLGKVTTPPTGPVGFLADMNAAINAHGAIEQAMRAFPRLDAVASATAAVEQAMRPFPHLDAVASATAAVDQAMRPFPHLDAVASATAAVDQAMRPFPHLDAVASATMAVDQAMRPTALMQAAFNPTAAVEHVMQPLASAQAVLSPGAAIEQAIRPSAAIRAATEINAAVSPVLAESAAVRAARMASVIAAGAGRREMASAPPQASLGIEDAGREDGAS